MFNRFKVRNREEEVQFGLFRVQGQRQVHVVQSRVAFGDGTGPAGSVGRDESALRSGGGEAWAARRSQ